MPTFTRAAEITHASLSNERKAIASARSRAAFAANNAPLGQKRRQRAKREGYRGELWKPFAKRLVLTGIKTITGNSSNI
eukprot:8036331-Pyramimonas_sp.AAC.1